MNLGLSLTRFDIHSIRFIGLTNYKNLFTDKFFLIALRNTAIYTFFTLFFTMGLGLFFAVILNEQFIFQRVYRSAIFLPYVTSMVAISMVWLWMYEPASGVINHIMTILGLPKQNWLHDPALAMPCIIGMSVWKFLGYYMVIYLAGLQAIPAYLYEAATIDGANYLQKFRKITFPMLKPVTFFLFVTGLIMNFNVFEQVLIMTNGGPQNTTTTVVHQIYIRAFFQFLLGYGSALAFFIVIIIAIITMINFRYGSRGVDIGLG
jgi:ABC-type sugar transport system permease subunit